MVGECHHYGCAFDCPLAPWNQNGGPMTRIQILKRWVRYMREMSWERSRARDPMWIYAQDRRGLWWLDTMRFVARTA